ncbi:nck-associated protein 1-like isoform X2 [Narcine bancroftii]|uniref:nck-associated protein 1-like isoform X2 n=1 Tax=Narcine bancroftii TaxID=1343680 RepID=UPI003831DBF9
MTMAGVGDRVNFEDEDGLLVCPYNQSHRIRASRFPYHLVKCRKNFPNKAQNLESCPFNARHRIPKAEMKHHITHCVDQKVIEDEFVINTHRRPSEEASSHWQCPTPEEDWETDEDGSSRTFIFGSTSQNRSYLSPSCLSVNEVSNSIPSGVRAPSSFPEQLLSSSPYLRSSSFFPPWRIGVGSKVKELPDLPLQPTCSEPQTKLPYLTEKTMEPAIKYISRKFPTIDLRTHSLSSIQKEKSDVLRNLNSYYQTFVEVLELRDNVYELLNTMDTCQISLDISMNYDLTKGYLDLVTTFMSLVLLMARVDDRKVLVGLYNCAYEMSNGTSDMSYSRLGQMLVDYDHPLKKLTEEFEPHWKLLMDAVMSLRDLFPRRNMGAQQWRGAQLLSVIGFASSMLKPTTSSTMPCEYLSLEVMEKWIIMGFLLCPSGLNSERTCLVLWKEAMQCSLCIELFRDEVLFHHKATEELFNNMKGGSVHRERRNFLRDAAKELSTVLGQEPGLLGPKALFVFMALSLSRDEISWLVRHANHITKTKTPEDYIDGNVAELLFIMEELRRELRTYRKVVQRYFLVYLSHFDAVTLNETIQNLSVCPEEESVIMSSFVNTLTSLNIKQVDNNDEFDFRGLRLDWYRLQAYTSVGKTPLILREHLDLASLMNMIVFHTRMLDDVEGLLAETADLTMFCFYPMLFEKMFLRCSQDNTQLQFLIAFPMVCSHFSNTLHPMCPEEDLVLQKRSLMLCANFLEGIAKQTSVCILELCLGQRDLSEKLLPKYAAQTINKVKKKKRPSNRRGVAEQEMPGAESQRKDRLVLTTTDRLHLTLTGYGKTINHVPEIIVFDHILRPVDYLTTHLEIRLSKAIVGLAGYNRVTQEISRPSEVLSGIRAFISFVHSVAHYINVDVSKICKDVLLQQSQAQDANGEVTLTAAYTSWYLESLLRQTSTGAIIHSPAFKSFVTIPVENLQIFNAEEYSDVMEMRALAELIGPYGMKYLSEHLMWHVTSQVTELKKLVVENMDILVQLRANLRKPDTMAALAKRLTSSENVLKRMVIIGLLLTFRSMAQEALRDVLSKHIPFLMGSVDLLHSVVDTTTDRKDMLHIYALASAVGASCLVDPVLVDALTNQKSATLSEEEYRLTCLLLLFISVSLPALATDPTSTYQQEHQGHRNNIHCLARGISEVAAALHTVHKQDIQAHLKEFLMCASMSLLQIGQETEKPLVRSRESVYLLLHMLVEESPFLSMDLLEPSFPYVLLRNAFREVYRPTVMTSG